MTRAPFRQIDITRAVRGARAAGVEVSGIKIDGGQIVILTGAIPAGSALDALDAADGLSERLDAMQDGQVSEHERTRNRL